MRQNHPAYLSKLDAETFLKRLEEVKASSEGPFNCEHGHYSCSTFTGGPCSDEVLSIFPELGD